MSGAMWIMMAIMMGGIAFAWIRSLRRKTKRHDPDSADQQD
jgi:preprotein translocase subunit YajC